MRILKHGFLSLIRKPAKVLMIFAILFVVFSLLFTGVIIQNSIDESKVYIRKQLGAAVEYKADYQKAYSEELAEEDYMKLQLSKTVAEDIATDSVVSQVYYTNSNSLMSNSMKTAEYWERDGQKEYYDNTYFDEEGNEIKDNVYFQLNGGNVAEPLEFSEGNYFLLDGNFPTEAQVKDGYPYALITRELAERNNLVVGDFMELFDWEENTYELEVLGIYDGIQEGHMGNTFFVSYEFNRNMMMAMYPEETEVMEYVNRIIFMLDDPLEVDGFVERSTSKLPSEYNYLDAATTQFDTLTKPLDLISLIASLLIWVVFGAGIIIIIAIVSIFVRDRKFEVGLLLSCGESKFRIILQFVYEILCIGLVAFVLAILMSNVSSTFVSDWIVENQLVEEESAPGQGNNMYYGYYDTSVFGDVDMNNIAEDFNVSINQEVIFKLFVINIALLIFASLVPLSIIMMFKPRQVLQD